MPRSRPGPAQPLGGPGSALGGSSGALGDSGVASDGKSYLFETKKPAGAAKTMPDFSDIHILLSENILYTF